MRTGLTLESPLNLRTRRAHAYRSRRAALLCETTVVVKSPGRCSHRCGRVTLQGKDIWARAREKGYQLKFYLHFVSPLLPPLLVQSSGATLPNLSRPQLWSSHLAGAHERHAFEPQLWTSCQAGTQKGGGFSGTALGHRPQNRAKGRRPKNRYSSKAKRVSARVFCLFLVLACLCRGFPGSGSLVLRPCPFGFLFVFVPPDVSFYWPRASRSSSQREGRRVKRRGTDPRTGPF